MSATQLPVDSRAVRDRLVEALRLDLVGPRAGHELDAEQLPGRERPSNWYVAGFLIPTGTPAERSADADEDDDLDTVPESAGLAEESNDERKTARKAFFPSSIGLSFLVGAACSELTVRVRWGDYAPAEIEEAGGGGKTSVWRRTPHEAVLTVPLGGDAGPEVRGVPGSGGLQLHVVERSIGAMGTAGAELPAGTRSASCFLVNRRKPDEAHEAGGAGNPRNPADPYMTALAYFNSLRELGGARRIIEEEVRTTVARYGARCRVGETRRLFRDRTDFSEPVELTSRVSTDQVAEARRRLECRFEDRRNRVDCALATMCAPPSSRDCSERSRNESRSSTSRRTPSGRNGCGACGTA